MITNKILAAHILRLYVWELLDQNTTMDKIDNLVPVLPVEDEPKVSNSGKAYIIYGYSESESRRLEPVREGVFSCRIIAPTFAELGQISNTISLAFESSDIATEAVNIFSTNYPNEALLGIRFTHAKTSYVEGGEAADTEGGPLDGVVNITYRYINSLPTPIPNSVGNNRLWA